MRRAFNMLKWKNFGRKKKKHTEMYGGEFVHVRAHVAGGIQAE